MRLSTTEDYRICNCVYKKTLNLLPKSSLFLKPYQNNQHAVITLLMSKAVH